MYNGTNPVALRSIDMISDAMLELLQEKNIDEISIKELCLTADVSRPTFYQMFDSKEEIVLYRMREFFATYRREILEKQIAPTDLSSVVHIFFQVVAINPAFRNVVRHNDFSNLLSQAFMEFLGQIEELRFRQLSDEENNYLYAFVSGAVTQVIQNWFKTNYQLPADQVADLTLNMIYGTFFDHSNE